MKLSIDTLLKGTFWTIGAFGLSSAIRFFSNIILARLLSPQLFGVMLIVSTIRIGVELFTDLGIGQNMIHSKDAANPEFYTTAWTLQFIRSVLIWLLFIAICVPLARFYENPALAYILPVAGFGIILSGLNSIGLGLLHKQMMIYKINIFEIITQIISAVVLVTIAYFYRTIWALVFGGLVGSAVYTIGSYFLVPGIDKRIKISRKYFWDIVHFGKWIFLSSILYFLAVNIDRLYLAKAISLSVLGIYGIARSMSDLIGNLIGRIGYNVLFPFIAAHSNMPRRELRAQLASLRARFLGSVAIGTSLIVASADLAVKFLYDERYKAAIWILPVLIIGSWFSVVVNVNESTLLGLGKPSYGTISNALKLAFMFVCLPLSVNAGGLFGGVVVIALSDIPRYVPIYIGQRRESFAFLIQDLSVTIIMLGLIGVFEMLRWKLGFGTSFDLLPMFGIISSAGS